MGVLGRFAVLDYCENMFGGNFQNSNVAEQCLEHMDFLEETGTYCAAEVRHMETVTIVVTKSPFVNFYDW